MHLDHLVELGPIALLAVLTSWCVERALSRFGTHLRRLAPDARWRVSFAAAWCPAIAALLFSLGASLDWLRNGPAAFCVKPGGGEHASLLMTGSAIVALSALAWRCTRVLTDGIRSWRIARRLARSSYAAGTYREFSSSGDAIAFVAGLWRPAVYVSTSLRESLRAEDLAVVLAHEHSHSRRRDPLRRMLANLALCFHLPHAAGSIAKLLGESQELIADAEAARCVGDRMQVAETIVRCGRLQLREPPGVAAFSGASLATRLNELVSERAFTLHPTPADLLGTLALLFSACAICGRVLHFAWQSLLRLP